MKVKESNEMYTNCYSIIKQSNYFLYIFIGGRGIGKTYSMLRGSFFDNKKIMYLRRTDTELKNCFDEFSNPYKVINFNENCNIHIEPIKDSAIIYNILPVTDVNSENQKELVGYASALSTFGKFRGADFSDVDLIVFDEFINTSPMNTLKNESYLLFNLIETVNRNRELEGLDSIKVVLLSNANTIDNDIIRVLDLADKIQLMKLNNKSIYTDDERGIYLSLLDNKKVKDMKMKTRLYKLTKGTSFYDMALNNEFTRDYFGDLKKVNYQELTPLCSFNNLYFYTHKSKDLLFVSKRKANCENFTDRNLEAFKRCYGYTIDYYMTIGNIFYSDYAVKLDTLHIFKGG